MIRECVALESATSESGWKPRGATEGDLAVLGFCKSDGYQVKGQSTARRYWTSGGRWGTIGGGRGRATLDGRFLLALVGQTSVLSGREASDPGGGGGSGQVCNHVTSRIRRPQPPRRSSHYPTKRSRPSCWTAAVAGPQEQARQVRPRSSERSGEEPFRLSFFPSRSGRTTAGTLAVLRAACSPSSRLARLGWPAWVAWPAGWAAGGLGCRAAGLQASGFRPLPRLTGRRRNFHAKACPGSPAGAANHTSALSSNFLIRSHSPSGLFYALGR